MKVLLAGGLAAIAVLAAGCDMSGKGPVGKAADKTMHAGNVRLAVAETLTQNGKSATVHGNGIANLGDHASDIKLDVGPAGIPGLGSLEELVADGTIYLQTPDAGLQPGQWVRLTPAQLSTISGSSSALPSSGLDPSTFISTMADSDAPNGWQKLDAAQVDGVATTHYRTVIDVASELAKYKSHRDAQQKALAASPYHSAVLTYDVWVGKGDGRFHRAALGVTGATPTAVRVVFTFSSFGTSASVHVPAKGRTVSVSDLQGT